MISDWGSALWDPSTRPFGVIPGVSWVLVSGSLIMPISPETRRPLVGGKKENHGDGVVSNPATY